MQCCDSQMTLKTILNRKVLYVPCILFEWFLSWPVAGLCYSSVLWVYLGSSLVTIGANKVIEPAWCARGEPATQPAGGGPSVNGDDAERLSIELATTYMCENALSVTTSD